MEGTSPGMTEGFSFIGAVFMQEIDPFTVYTIVHSVILSISEMLGRLRPIKLPSIDPIRTKLST